LIHVTETVTIEVQKRSIEIVMDDLLDDRRTRQDGKMGPVKYIYSLILIRTSSTHRASVDYPHLIQDSVRVLAIEGKKARKKHIGSSEKPSPFGRGGKEGTRSETRKVPE
jgi:hypothetical protein